MKTNYSVMAAQGKTAYPSIMAAQGKSVFPVMTGQGAGVFAKA